jgi:hypothetical protein
MTTHEIAEQLTQLPALFKSALLGTDEDIVDSVVGSWKQEQLGREMIKLVGLLLLARKELQDRPPFIEYIREIVFKGRYYLEGYAVTIINDACEIIIDQPYQTALQTFHQSVCAWLGVMNQVKEKHRVKQYLLLSKDISSNLLSLATCFRALVPLLIQRDPTGNEELSQDLLPFLIEFNVEGAAVSALFSLQAVSKKECKVWFTNLPARNEWAVDFGDTRSVQARQLKESLEKFKHVAGSQESGSTSSNHDMSLVPLLADSQPQMLKLADHLLKHTTQVTWEKLWVNKMVPAYYKDLNSFPKSEHERWFKSHMTAMRDTILLDCLENDPLVVLLKVAHEEGEDELSNYLRQLLGGKAEERMNRAKEASGWDGTKKTSLDRRKFTFYQRLLAVDVASEMGFVVCKEHLLKGASWFLEEVSAQLNVLKVGKKMSCEELQGRVIEVVRSIYEPVMKDVCLFYSYVKMSIELSPNGSTLLDFTSSEWQKMVSDIRGSTPGALLQMTRDLFDNQNILDYLKDRVGLGSNISSKTLRERTRDSAPDNMIAILNKFKHDTDKIAELDGALRRKDAKVVKKYVTQFVQDVKNLLEYLIDTEHDQDERVFPYKLTFAVRSETFFGIKRCGYYTDACDEESTRETEIYCEEGIELGRVYLCLPDRRRRSSRVWINPLLVSADILSRNLVP